MTMSAFGGSRVATSAKSRVRLTCTTLLVLLVLAFSAGRFFPSDLRSDLDLIRHSGGVGDDQAAQSGEGRRAVDKWVQDEFKDANVVIWESAIHDGESSFQILPSRWRYRPSIADRQRSSAR